MTLDDPKRQNTGFYGFLAMSGCVTHFKSELRQNEIDVEKLHMNFSALNVDYDGASSRKPSHEGIKERYPRKSRYFTVIGSLSWKRLQIGMGMPSITTSNSDKLFSRINIDDFKKPWTSKIRGFIHFCDLRLQRHSKN